MRKLISLEFLLILQVFFLTFCRQSGSTTKKSAAKAGGDSSLTTLPAETAENAAPDAAATPEATPAETSPAAPATTDATACTSGDCATPAAPTLNDLFSGKAYFPSYTEASAEEVKVTLSNASANEQKINIFNNPDDTSFPFYAIAKGNLPSSPTDFDIFLLKSSDGLNFTQVGNPIFQTLEAKYSFNNPHLLVDSTSTPARYIMSMECVCKSTTSCTKTDPTNNLRGAFVYPSLCISSSTTPWDANSWSVPMLIVQNNGKKTAASGVGLIDQNTIYFKWTVIDYPSSPDSPNTDLGHESASSWAANLDLQNLTKFYGLSTDASLVWGAYNNTLCTNAWDCNRVDVHDWKHEGSFYYAIYSGSNYYECARPGSSTDPISWGLSIRRASAPMGDYSESIGNMIPADRTDTCGINYPVINYLNNQTYLYYHYYPRVGSSKMMRSKLSWIPSGASPKVSVQAKLPDLPDFAGKIASTVSFPQGTILKSGSFVALGNSHIALQTDGNLVVYDGFGKAKWASGIHNKICANAVCRLDFQADGNLVLYDGSNVAYWNTNTNRNPGITSLIFSNQDPYIKLIDATNGKYWASPSFTAMPIQN